jgi:hypothetical protein
VFGIHGALCFRLSLLNILGQIVTIAVIAMFLSRERGNKRSGKQSGLVLLGGCIKHAQSLTEK